MVNPENVGIMIAVRDLLLDGGQKVQVLIGRPERLPGSDDWYCPNQIVGIGSEEVKCVCGVDAMQALVADGGRTALLLG
jgi:hypothetical protein